MVKETHCLVQQENKSYYLLQRYSMFLSGKSISGTTVLPCRETCLFIMSFEFFETETLSQIAVAINIIFKKSLAHARR